MQARIRLVIAAVVVVATLLAVSAWFKDATCDCGGRGLPWDAVALAASAVAAVSVTVYVVLDAVVRRR